MAKIELKLPVGPGELFDLLGRCIELLSLGFVLHEQRKRLFLERVE